MYIHSVRRVHKIDNMSRLAEIAQNRRTKKRHMNGIDWLPIIECSGTPYEIGRSIGEQDRRNIHRILAHHVDAAGWAGSSLVDVLELDVDPKEYWGTDGWAELQGMADGAGVPVENLVYQNLQKYALGACTHFAQHDESTGRFLHGANIDVPASLLLRDSMTYHVQKRRPKGGIPYVLPGMPGVLLGIDGFNEKGLFVSSSMLLDEPQPKRLRGTNHGVIISRLLQSCNDLSEAVRFLSVIAGWGGWAIAVSCPKEKRVVYAEYHGNRTIIDEKSNRFVCSNHSRLFPATKIPDHSRLRLERLEGLLNSDRHAIDLRSVLFDRYNPNKSGPSKFRTMNTVFRVDHVVSLLADETGKCFFALTRNAEQTEFIAAFDCGPSTFASNTRGT